MVAGVVAEVPEGYIETEIGIIPDDWVTTNIGSFAPLQRGFDLPSRLRIDGLYPVVYSNGIVNYHTNYQVKGPGVVTGRSGTIGKVHYVDDNYWPHNTTLWVTNFLNAYPKFVYYLFLKIGFNRFASGSGVPTLNRNDAHSFKVAIPSSLKEQTAIATALSDVDSLITSLTKLIDKKRDIKTATMQQLLTGKKRLPPFDKKHTGYKQTEVGVIPKDWECIESKDAINFIGGYGFSSKLATSYGVRWLKISNVGLNEIKWDVESYLPHSLVKDFKDYELKPDDIVMALTRPILSDKLKIAKIKKNDTPSLLNQRVAKLITNSGYQIEYLYYVVQRLSFVTAMNILMAGTDPPNIGTVALGKIKIATPPSLEEQTAIGTVLSDIDKEIETLERRLSKTRNIKQGMMQELLTGRTRLI